MHMWFHAQLAQKILNGIYSRSNSPLEIKITGNSTPTHEILKRPKIEQKVDPKPKESSRPWHSGCEYCCQICGKMHYALNELLFHVRNKHNMTGKCTLRSLIQVNLF